MLHSPVKMMLNITIIITLTLSWTGLVKCDKVKHVQRTLLPPGGQNAREKKKCCLFPIGWWNMTQRGQTRKWNEEAFVFDLSDKVAHVWESQQVRLLPLICLLCNYSSETHEARPRWERLSVHWFAWTCVDWVLFMHLCLRCRYEWLSCKPAGCDRYRLQLCLLRPFLSFIPRKEKRAAKAEGKYMIVSFKVFMQLELWNESEVCLFLLLLF